MPRSDRSIRRSSSGLILAGVLAAAAALGGASPPAGAAPLGSGLSAGARIRRPVNLVPPALFGLPRSGRLLHASHGLWSHHPTAYAYRWKRCAAGRCVTIARVRSSTYRLGAQDVGKRMRVAVTAFNAAGRSRPAQSALSALVTGPAGGPPRNIVRPQIVGVARVGLALAATHGSWSGRPSSYAYRWLRCDAEGAGCASVAGADTATYPLRAGDLGATLRVVVIASNAAGRSAPARSAPSGVVTGSHGEPPRNVTPPQISGLARLGQLLHASRGSWTGQPTSYSYEWLRCSPLGSSCAAIAGAGSPAYVLGELDVGRTLRVDVIASNSAGRSAPARSAPSAVVTGPAEVSRLEYVLGPGMVHVYSIDERFKEVESFALPDSAGVRGVDVCPAKHVMYVSYGGDGGANGNGSALAYDLVEKKLIWIRSYNFGVDFGALTLDCSRLFEPTGENSSGGTWWILNTANGAPVAKLETAGSGPHDTVRSADGKLILLGARNYDRLPIYNTLTGTIQAQAGPLAGGVRPLTINGADTIAFTNATGLDGFQVSSTLVSALPLYTEDFSGSCPFSTCSHGISLSPDSGEVAVIDAARKAVQFWDVHAVTIALAPRHIASVPVAGLAGREFPCAYDCGRDGWVQHSFDGRYVFVGDSGDVIETTTHRVIAHLGALENSRQSIEVDWRGGVPVATSGRLGVGRAGG